MQINLPCAGLKNHRILVVDDSEAIHDDFRKILGSDAIVAEAAFDAEEAAFFGSAAPAAASRVVFEMSFAFQGAQALKLVENGRSAGQRYALAFMDMRMPPGWDGIETALKLWEVDPDLQVVICTAYSDKSREEMMEQVGNPERLLVLKKPFDTIEVLQLAHALTEKWMLLQSSRHNLEELEHTVRARTRELQASEQRFRKLSADAPIGIFETDAAGRVVYTNPQWQRITGLSLEDSLGDGWRQAIDPEDAEALFTVCKSAICEGRAFHADFRFRTTGDDIRWVEAHTTPIRSETGEVTGFVGSVNDITERKAIERELARARDVALEAAHSKAQFLANMSHEIRTPMNGVIGMASLLLDTKLDREQRDFVETIRQSGDLLLSIINDILDFSKIDAGKLVFETIDFDLREVVENTLELLAEKAQTKGLELLGVVSPEATVYLRGDPGRLRQILTNLVGNAIKFTGQGEVVLSVTQQAQTAAAVTLRFEIRDTGIGIDSEARERLFQAFSQADGSTTRKYGGTGLGLAIARQLVEMMHGEIGVESEPGRGSTFWFTVQLGKQPIAQSDGDAVESAELAGSRVLIVDDNATNRHILELQFARLHMRSQAVSGGREALETLRLEAANGAPFDLVVLDVQMPEMDGLMLARAIRSDANLSSTPLILLSSLGDPMNSGGLKDVGVQEYLVKPVKQSRLYDSVISVMRRRGEQSEAAESRAEPSPESLSRPDNAPRRTARILLAEDNAINQKVALRQLQKLGYRADVVADGVEVLEALRRSSYDIILMDCQMPELDGYETTRRIRNDSSLTDRPLHIIAMTANAMQGDRERCLAAGMDDYVTKPVATDELELALGRWRPCEEMRNGSPQEQEMVEDWPIDLEMLREACEGDTDMMREVVELCLEQAEEIIPALGAAIQAGSSQEVNSLAHTLRGACATCGMMSLVPSLQELERLGAAGDLTAASLQQELAAAELARIRRFPFEERFGGSFGSHE